MATKTRRVFFESCKYPGVIMNKYGVALVSPQHELAHPAWSKSFEWVPLANGNLRIKDEIQDEARDSGYTYRYLNDGERLYSKPKG